MQRPLVTGSVVKIWHDSRGHDYLVVACGRDNNRVGLIKHTSINADGTIHKSSLRKMVRKAQAGETIFDKVIDLDNESTATGRIRRINGTRSLQPGVVTQLLTSFQMDEQWSFVKNSSLIYPPSSALDSRIATQY